ncbi:MAG: hypothetical protein V7K97_01705, partial [Nostoc sp.]
SGILLRVASPRVAVGAASPRVVLGTCTERTPPGILLRVASPRVAVGAASPRVVLGMGNGALGVKNYSPCPLHTLISPMPHAPCPIPNAH